MNISQFASILRARKWVALFVLLVIVIGTIAVSLVLPKQYTGLASVVVDVKPDPISAFATGGINPGFMATQVDIMGSERVALKVIRDLRLDQNGQIRDQWLADQNGQGSIEQWLVQILKRQLDIVPSRESNVISITYQSPDANFASTMANAFAQAYIATTLELKVAPARQFNTFFDSQAKEARDALERSQGKLSSFQRQRGIIATDERLDIESARLAELSSQLTQVQAIAADSSSRQQQAGGAGASTMQEVLSNPLISGLKADLARNEARVEELNQKYGASHPQVVEAKANIAELRTKINAEIARVTGGVRVNNTINRSREAQLKASLDEQRAKLLGMKEVRDEGLVLQREVDNAQRTYDNILARMNQTSLESQATQGYANMLTVAQPPSEPSSPKVLRNALVAVGIGFLLAVGAVVVLESLDRRVRQPIDLVMSMQMPVLGALPKRGARRIRGAFGRLSNGTGGVPRLKMSDGKQ